MKWQSTLGRNIRWNPETPVNNMFRSFEISSNKKKEETWNMHVHAGGGEDKHPKFLSLNLASFVGEIAKERKKYRTEMEH
jgi:hypothetical protein